MQKRSVVSYVFLLLALVAGGAGADERYDGTTQVRGEGEVAALPDISNISVNLTLSCWKDFGALQKKADAFHNAVLDVVKGEASQGENRYSADGVNLFPQSLTMPEKIVGENGKPEIVQVPDPECTNVNGASSPISLKYVADFVQREEEMAKNRELTGFEAVAKIRNALAAVISQHVNNSKVDGVRASLTVEFENSPKYGRHLRDEAREAADADYELQLAKRKNACKWLSYKVISVTYESDRQGGARSFLAAAGGYSKRDLSAETHAIAPASLHPGERVVSDAVVVNIAYISRTQECQVE